MAKCECKDCPRKGCGSYHDECESYQRYLAERKAISDERTQRRNLDDYFVISVGKSVKRRSPLMKG